MQPLVTFLKILIFSISAHSAAAEDNSSLEQHRLQHDGIDRHFALYAPPYHYQIVKRPLVIVLHGGGGNGEHASMMTGFTRKAQQEDFFVVYPDGSGRLANALLTWNAGHCCGYAMQNQIDDVGFIRNLIDKLVRDYPIDPHQVFVTGMSNGGMMTHRLGIELGGKIAGIGPVVATLFGSEAQPATPVPTLIINGALDKSVPPEGGPTGGRSAFAWDGTPTQPAAYQATFWANANGCKPEPQSNSTGSPTTLINTWRYTCPPGQDVVRYLIGDNGHAWPGGQPGRRQADAPSASFNATDVIWDFFKSQMDR